MLFYRTLYDLYLWHVMEGTLKTAHVVTNQWPGVPLDMIGGILSRRGFSNEWIDVIRLGHHYHHYSLVIDLDQTLIYLILYSLLHLSSSYCQTILKMMISLYVGLLK